MRIKSVHFGPSDKGDRVTVRMVRDDGRPGPVLSTTVAYLRTTYAEYSALHQVDLMAAVEPAYGEWKDQ